MKYTSEDVIRDEFKARELGLKVGMEVFYTEGNMSSESFTSWANADTNTLTGILKSINYNKAKPFEILEHIENHLNPSNRCPSIIPATAVIIKKYPQKRYVPFDLSNKEDRDFLRGKWIRYTEWEDEYLIDYFISAKNNGEGRWMMGGHYDGNDLLTKFTFMDTGLPVGKEE